MSVLPNRSRAILSLSQVIEIFKIKLTATTLMQKCPSPWQISALFGVSEKAVRDIWKGRTWARETHHLEPSRQVLMRKRRGRPSGSMDSRSRKASKPGIATWSRGLQVAVEDLEILKTDVTSLHCYACAANGQRNRMHNADFCAHRCVASDSASADSHQPHEWTASIDYQLHEWMEGTSSLSELADPFGADWTA